MTGISRFRRFSWQNVLLITAQRPGATQVAGIHAWNDFSRVIKTNEKGILIFAPAHGRDESLTSRASSRIDPFPPAGNRTTYVSDASQTEGGTLPDLAPTRAAVWNDRECVEIAERLRLHTRDKRELARNLAALHETATAGLDQLDTQQRTTEKIGKIAIPRAPAGGEIVEGKDFARLHEQYRSRVVKHVAGMVRNHDVAEDVAAKAFEVAWETREAFRGEASPYTWIQAIARNVALDALRRRVPMEPVEFDKAAEFVAAEHIIDELERRDDLSRLQDALDRLPAKYRSALTDHFIEGLSIRDIARRARVPLGTVLSRIHTGKQLLHEAWDASLARPITGINSVRSTTELGQKTPTPSPATSEPESPAGPPAPNICDR